ncbi:DUF3611 family protein [Microseira sp. BLCC-F43]|jgi:hypothetical protein|uniref:DUF3611 family protein n=1 Tax=Microseira sp. BLCC-F43 TaxID=3153602 RepID=UPI0035B73E91
MQTEPETRKAEYKRERVAMILRLVGWIALWLQIALAAASSLMLVLAISGRNFNQAVTPAPETGVVNSGGGTTPGLGIGVFWAFCGILALLFGAYLAFRQTRFARRLRNPNHILHPKKTEVMRVLRLGVIVGLVGMLLTILGGGATLGVLLSKSISQPQGVAIYNPARFIRSLDIFVAMANMNGIAANFVGTVASLGLYNWLDNQQSG